ncbi:MAG TPA: helix-turn-helix domain-containing protein [Candidatus Hydrogenedentes bacterium]|nr:helix-turn-helix domain-containing protein [Candidatus Hydrogenedentota bacterium]
MDEMLTVEEVAEILKVRPLTVRQMFREQRLRGFKIGKAWRTTRTWLNEDLVAMSQGVATPPMAAVSESSPPPKRAKRKPAAGRLVSPVSAGPDRTDSDNISIEESKDQAAESPAVRVMPASAEGESGSDPVSSGNAKPSSSSHAEEPSGPDDPQQYLF